MRISIRSWLYQVCVASWQGRLEPKYEGFCIHIQKFELYPADNKADREFLCMRMTWSALFFRNETWQRGGRQENIVWVWTEAVAVGRERTYGDERGFSEAELVKVHNWFIGREEKKNRGTKDKTGTSSLGGVKIKT